jgi:hypothetical protein
MKLGMQLTKLYEHQKQLLQYAVVTAPSPILVAHPVFPRSISITYAAAAAAACAAFAALRT